MRIYKITAPTVSWKIETKEEQNTVGSRNIKDAMCEVVVDNPDPAYKFQRWWLNNVNRYCDLRGWTIERIV